MASNDKFALIRRRFPHTKKVTYFNAGSYGPFSIDVQQAIEANISQRVAAERDDSHDAFETQDELRAIYARMIGARKREVGIGLNTSFGLNIAAFGLPLNKTDEVLVSDVEFPAIRYTWRAAAEARGFRLKVLKSRGRCFDMDALRRGVTKRSKVLTVSWVQFFNGYKADLQQLSEFCRENGMFFVVDGIQGMGVEPINTKIIDIDVFTSGCQKWMLAPQGCGFFYLSDRIRDRLKQPFMSWLGSDWKMNFTDLFRYEQPFFDSARRFEMGYYVVLNMMAMKAAAEMFVDLGIRNIQRHNYALIDRLADFIDSHPYYTITSNMEPTHRSSIFTFTCDDYKSLHRELLKNKIILVQREGSIRVSVHLYNNERDIDKTIGVLQKFARGR
ncbi:MAG: aminotransferase class V-fold PLP-dependent enzyme [candidate division Zixibacteria bacterium]|nr:aminotransferase class V-fold PLP-dependent enzyme [candidate division Zixibacteria bacterium]MDH3937596.1 aminotransferase class V-fold PLP-dependent enzyme [candidate division Zixibacteria bacterium]MDH4035087.1 aminotransferase class V-fold PLP-dependent enzyme [candidate division Zixibacteria bacterium]